MLAESFSLSCLCHDYEGKEVKCGLQVFGLMSGNEVVGKNANTQIYIPSSPMKYFFHFAQFSGRRSIFTLTHIQGGYYKFTNGNIYTIT